MKRKVLYITGNRADYGFMLPVLRKISVHPKLELNVAVTGMHLMEEFGNTISVIRKDGFGLHEIPAWFDTTDVSPVQFLGSFLTSMTKEIRKINPDFILVAGDRAEMLGGAIVASYSSIPIAHVSGGDVSSTVDEHVRHAITKLSQIHFPYTKKSAERIFKMGEDRWRIYVVGSPGVYHMLNLDLIPPKEIARRYNLDLSQPFLLMIQHPVTLESADAPKQIRQTLTAVIESDVQTILIYPNADLGGIEMIKVIQEYKNNPLIKPYRSIPSTEFFSLMKIAGAMIGNSSSGIVEAPSFSIPVINIGSRQDGREQAGNVINVRYDTIAIKRAIRKALFDKKFRDGICTTKNPYDRGDAASKIADVLAKVEINNNLLQKKLRY